VDEGRGCGCDFIHGYSASKGECEIDLKIVAVIGSMSGIGVMLLLGSCGALSYYYLKKRRKAVEPDYQPLELAESEGDTPHTPSRLSLDM